LRRKIAVLDFVYTFLSKLGYSHPIHPTEVHMPIGLVVGATFFSFTALLFHRKGLLKTARNCIILSFIWVFPTMLFGIMDWQHFYAGAWLFPIKVKLIMAPLLAILLFVAIMLGRRGREGSPHVVTVYVLCFITVVILGYFGGQMVYGVKKVPSSEQSLKGGKIFKANCSACHPDGGNVVMPDMPVKSSAELSSYDTFIAFIRDPKLPDGSKGPMPPFPQSKISEADGKALYEYMAHAFE
jgi:uncharacterized membrane protein